MNLVTNHKYNRFERDAVASLQSFGVSLECVTSPHDVCKAVETHVGGIVIHLPNSDTYDESCESFDTFVVSWDVNGMGRLSWMFDDAETTALFVTTAPHRDTHPQKLVESWARFMTNLALNQSELLREM